MDMNKDNHRISKLGRDSSNTMMMIKSNNITTPKSHSLNYLYNNNNGQTSYEDQEDLMVNAFSWPPRSYTCSFCKREFRSAQALGGHMNVHRKDRARLRQSPPSDIIHGLYGNSTFLNLNLNHNPNPNPNPNPNFPGSFNIATSNSQPPLSSLLSSPYNSAHNNDISSKKWPSAQVNHRDLTSNINGSDLTLMKSQKLVSNGVKEDQVLEGFARKSLKKKIFETTTTVRLDLEIGLLRDNKSEVGLDLDVDLELRLGYST